MNKVTTLDDRSLLLTLEECSHLVSHSHDAHETLNNIVRLIRQRFQTAVCSVYLLEPERRELVLGATVGLQAEGVGRVRMSLDEGLTGLVAEQRAPVMVEDAFSHPRFKYFPEAGEDPYRSFLGVPLLESGSLEGVLVVQTTECRPFTPAEVRMLVTVAAQVASLVSDARLLEKIVAAAHGAPAAEVPQVTSVRGVPLSPGTGLGRAYIVNGFEELRREAQLTSDDPALEQARLTQSMHSAREEISRLSHRISELSGEDHGAILHAQSMLMQDRAIERDLANCLLAGASAEGAIFETLDKYVAAFQKLSTPYFQERVYDIKDVFYRLLWHLRAPEDRAADGQGDPVVLIAHEASVMELFSVDPLRLAGVIVEHGSSQGHAAILARSLGIPMVGQVASFSSLLRPGRRLFVDGTLGTVYIDPSADFIPAPQPLAASDIDVVDASTPGLPRVEANVNLLCEAGPAARQGVGGVGLYRSEFLFLARRTLPTEDEQVEIYRKLIIQLNGRPVSIRTFDLRPDKLVAYSHLSSSTARPFDWRLVLESPQLQQLFVEQVRAILRAGGHQGGDGRGIGPVRILVPLVTRTEMLDFVLDTLQRVRTELRQQGIDHAERLTLGIMIEVAAAATMVPVWAEHVDYFALGTNDLTASALGLDREDPVSAGQIDSLHPGLLRIIDSVVQEAHTANRPVTVCGEMAADPYGCLVLASLGVDALSVPVNQLRAVRRVLAGLSPGRLRELAPHFGRLRTAEEVRQLLRDWTRTNMPNILLPGMKR